jgi:hypothetical protein
MHRVRIWKINVVVERRRRSRRDKKEKKREKGYVHI